MYRRALEGYGKALGPEHLYTLTSMANLGSVLERQGKYEEAEVMYRRALEGCGKVLGLEHPDTLTSVSNLGSMLAQQGKYEEAEAMYQRALEGQSKVLGPEHPSTLTTMDLLAHTWMSQDKIQDAMPLEDCVELRSRSLGLDHPDTKYSSRLLNEWKGTYSSLPLQQLRGIVQAEYDQSQEIPAECSAEVMVTNQTQEEWISLHQRQEQLSPVKKVVANHPLRGLLTSGTSSSVSRGPDITEVE
ncbi:Kif17 kinesin [Aspergillus lentulus]|uniref:Kif17 kinesin n=1 Tax=Aspergillus lentulus TaxID=293939 RepID=UPI00139530E1|nr:Kif17 kinesin [Aspergillus lentulus]GFF36287.1 Kif17 kinesin [Aspergillus lentulus]